MFTAGNETSVLRSNTVFTTLNTLVDVQNTAVSARADLIAPDTDGYTYSFIVTNTGNAADRFDLSAGFTSLSTPVAALWIDTNHNDLFDPDVDTRIDPNSALTLASGASVGILVLATARGNMALTATSLNDDPLASVANRSATAEIGGLNAHFRSNNAILRLVKTQTVDTQGAAGPGRGSIITYSLKPQYPRTAGYTGVRITDAIPARTVYVPGSLTLDDTPLSDAADSDAGLFDAAANTISVALSSDLTVTDINAPQIVRFQVRIK